LKTKIEFLLRSFNFKTFIFVVAKTRLRKYQEGEGKFMMWFAVQVHHAFVDGIHIGKLADKLQRYLDEV